MAQIIYPQQFWPVAPMPHPAGQQPPLMSFGALADTVETASASGVTALHAAAASLSQLNTSGDEVCAHAETLEDLAQLLDQQMQALMDRARDFTTALRDTLPRT